MKTLLLLIAFAFSLAAQDLDALYEQIKAENAHLTQEDKEREARFKADKARQKALLKEAEKELEALQRQSKSLQKRFDANEELLGKKEKELHARMGNLGELFGVVRQYAGDMAGIVRGSMVTAQLPERGAFLETMSKTKALPSSSDLESLWLHMFEEMVEAGKVADFTTEIVLADGSAKTTEVTRVGLFTAATDTAYLRYDSQERKLVELPRQPEGPAMARLDDLRHGSGLVTAVIDPTRGSIFELMMEKPTFSERVAQGGVIGYVILGLGAVGLLIALVRGVLLLAEGGKVKGQLKTPEAPKTNNSLGRILGVYNENKSETVETIESRLDEAILKEMPRITQGESIIKLLAAVAPLLGLLGTVVGMIETFQAITLFGTGDPKLMAGGISQALVTTMLGLIVAVPLLFAHTLVRSRSRAILEVLSQQSAGMVARRMEQTGP